METKRYSEVQKDIPGHFVSPNAILSNTELAAEQKVALLKQWEFDLRQLLVASEENMTDQTAKPGKSGELLRSVSKALLALEEENPALIPAGEGPPTKAGGKAAN